MTCIQKDICGHCTVVEYYDGMKNFYDFPNCPILDEVIHDIYNEFIQSDKVVTSTIEKRFADLERVVYGLNPLQRLIGGEAIERFNEICNALNKINPLAC